MIENVAEALFVLASVADTVWLPVVEAGAVKDALNEPTLEVVTVAGVVVCATVSYATVIVEEEAKPVPVTVTDVPTFPLVGLRVIFDSRLKVAEAVLALASVAETV